VVAAFGQQRQLVQVAEQAIADPQPRRGVGRGALAHLADGAGHEGALVGLAVGVGGQGHGQARGHVLHHQEFAAQDPALDPAQGLETLGDELEALAVEGVHVEAVEAGG